MAVMHHLAGPPWPVAVLAVDKVSEGDLAAARAPIGAFLARHLAAGDVITRRGLNPTLTPIAERPGDHAPAPTRPPAYLCADAGCDACSMGLALRPCAPSSAARSVGAVDGRRYRRG
ncbi:hypothetical protein STENM327S_04463 [Streptomyces tendae]